MTHRHHKATLVLAILWSIVMALMVLILGLAIASAPATAQIQESPNSTTSENSTTVIQQLDGAASITGYSFENGTATIDLDLDESRTVTVTQSIRSPDSKVGTIPVEVFVLRQGEQTVKLPLRSGTDMDEAAITISTPESVADGRMVFLTASADRGEGTLIPSIRAWATGAGVAVVAGVLAWKRRENESETKPVPTWGDE